MNKNLGVESESELSEIIIGADTREEADGQDAAWWLSEDLLNMMSYCPASI